MPAGGRGVALGAACARALGPACRAAPGHSALFRPHPLAGPAGVCSPSHLCPLFSCHAIRAILFVLPPLWLQEKDEYVEQIIADMQRLGLDCSNITYTSDYFPQVQNVVV